MFLTEHSNKETNHLNWTNSSLTNYLTTTTQHCRLKVLEGKPLTRRTLEVLMSDLVNTLMELNTTAPSRKTALALAHAILMEDANNTLTKDLADARAEVAKLQMELHEEENIHNLTLKLLGY